MDSVISWFILDVVALVGLIRFLIYILDQYEVHEEERRNGGKRQPTYHLFLMFSRFNVLKFARWPRDC